MCHFCGKVYACMSGIHEPVVLQRRTRATENHFSAKSMFLDTVTIIVLSSCTYYIICFELHKHV